MNSIKRHSLPEKVLSGSVYYQCYQVNQSYFHTVKFNLGDYDPGDFSLGDLGLWNFNLGDFDLSDDT